MPESDSSSQDSESGLQLQDRDITAYERFDKDSGNSYGLRVGTEIKFLTDMPAYKVEEARTEENPPRLKLVLQADPPVYTYFEKESQQSVTAHLPKEMVFTGTKTFIIGRGGEEGAGLLPVGPVSRTHASIHFEPKSGRFVMKALNRHPGKINNATAIGFLQAANITQASETLADFRPPGSEEETEVLLRPGMTVKLLPDEPKSAATPTYLVKTAVSGVKPQLAMEMIGDTQGYSKALRITLQGKHDSKSIGSIPGNDVVINHARISRMHGMLYYSDEQKSWIYQTSKAPPVVGVGNQFLADMGNVDDRVAGTPPDVARVEIAEIDRLIADMQDDRAGRKNVLDLMQKVQGLEKATIATPLHELDRGGRTEDSQRGYRNWVHAYKLLYKEDMSAGDRASLDMAMEAMETMACDREVLRDIESYANFPTGLKADARHILKECRKANYNNDMCEVVANQCKPLMEKPPRASFIVSGYRGHHTVTRIEQDKKGYLVTTYNTGSELKLAPDGENAMAKYSRHLNKGIKIEDFIRLVDERKVRRQWQGDSDKIDQVIESSLGPIESFTVAPPQHKGNCTTRSTREMLRDMLTPERFAHLHRHVSNPDVCDPADIMAALQMRREALAKIAPVQKPKNQVDWAQSVSDFRIANLSQVDDDSMMARRTPPMQSGRSGWSRGGDSDN